jgi:osmotically-inducible protein OsmY
VAAQEAAHWVARVHDVANELQVVVPATQARSDTELAQAVRHALEWNTLVPHQHIDTTVVALGARACVGVHALGRPNPV